MKAFYNVLNALKNIQNRKNFHTDDGRRKAVRQAIYAMSLINGIPEHLYMASLKSDPELFYRFTPEKAAVSKTENEIADMVALSQEARDWLQLNEGEDTFFPPFDHLQHRSTHRSKDSTLIRISP